MDTDRYSWAATCLFDRPAAASSATRRSLGVRPPAGAARRPLTRSASAAAAAAQPGQPSCSNPARACCRQSRAAARLLARRWDAARALLVLGRAQRRATKRAAARDSLQQAQSLFEQLGCPGWAGAATELDRISGRRAAPASGLTPGERRVAELAAAGLSNQQAATQLYLSVTTVKAHLRVVYAKLGVASRGQLTRRIGAGG